MFLAKQVRHFASVYGVPIGRLSNETFRRKKKKRRRPKLPLNVETIHLLLGIRLV
jgi:hypothetical protein